MTKQEDIREAVAREVRVGNDEEGWYVALNKADNILKVEAELGVVVKVTQKYPLQPHYIYEPLIEA